MGVSLKYNLGIGRKDLSGAYMRRRSDIHRRPHRRGACGRAPVTRSGRRLGRWPWDIRAAALRRRGRLPQPSVGTPRMLKPPST